MRKFLLCNDLRSGWKRRSGRYGWLKMSERANEKDGRCPYRNKPRRADGGFHAH